MDSANMMERKITGWVAYLLRQEEYTFAEDMPLRK